MSSQPSPEQSTPSDCPRCRMKKGEYYWYLGLYEFDVELAREFVADGREPVEVEEESVRVSVRESRIFDCHLDHVDPTIPGIIAHIFHRTPEGEVVHAHLLIDGNHRAARCLRDGLSYFAYVLSEDESRQILLLSPEMEAGTAEAPTFDEPHHQ